MLTYLINTIESLIATAILIGLAFAYARSAWGPKATRVVTVAVVAGLVAALVMAVLKHTTSLIDTGGWNMRLFIAAAVAGVLFLISFIPAIGTTKIGGAIAKVALAVFVFLRVFYKVPDVYLYPLNFNLGDNNIISSDFAVRITGYVVGIAVCVLACVAIMKCLREMGSGRISVSTALVVAIIGVVQMMTCFQTMLARRIIANNHMLFELVKFFSNNSQLFIIIIMVAAAVLAVVIIIQSLRDNEPYANPAEHRKLLAKRRNRRRWAICLLVCVLVSAVTITVVKDYNNRGPEITPAEESEVRDGNVYVALDAVGDEHLHRFVYVSEAGMQLSDGSTTEGGAEIRFIVIKKPNSSAYGIGLDACEICGETGYYERDDKVVCKLCDVVMNVNTIGFKGGCNPIPVPYTIEDGYIVLPTSGLVEYEKMFR